MPNDPHPPGPLPRAGELLDITRAASVQFTEPFRFRVIRALDRDTYYGWAWLDGYQLDAEGEAERRREIYVQLAGLRRVPETRPARTPAPRPGRRFMTS